MSKKKNNSTDNIIEFVTTNSISDPRTIEAMVREVDLALRYFQDAVSKRTYEMLPGMYTLLQGVPYGYGGILNSYLLCFQHKNEGINV